MKHLGDITQMSGYEIPPVDVITFGSPCQDLSIAGKRAGMAGERSGLFSEAVRIIREMRMATWGMYPKYAVWENVPGAYSSNKGEDFHAVIESLCQIIDPGVSVPRPKSEQRGGLLWPHAGAIVGNGYSLAWRTMDAQHWGVPQRRKRIALVLDLTGECAGEVLFEPESLRGHFAPCIAARQAAPGNAETGATGTNQSPPLSYTLKIRSGCDGGGKGALVQTEKSATLSTLQDQTLFVADALPFDTTQLTSPQNGSNPQWGDPCHPLAASAHTPAVITELAGKVFCIAGNVIDRSDTAGANGTGVKEDVSYTLNTVGRPAVVYDAGCGVPVLNDQGGNIMGLSYDVTGTLRAQEHGHQPIIFDARGNGDGKVVPTMTGDHNSRVTDYTAIALQEKETEIGVDLYSGTLTGQKTCALTASMAKGASMTGPTVIERALHWIVRRLTPTECERLQGYPDNWTALGEWVDSKGKPHKDADTPRYKALGNSIALPQWYYVLGGISDRLAENATLGSLFDGIGGFPKVWADLHNGNKRLCVWASEIEEFPIAVTRKHFPEE